MLNFVIRLNSLLGVSFNKLIHSAFSFINQRSARGEKITFNRYIFNIKIIFVAQVKRLTVSKPPLDQLKRSIETLLRAGPVCLNNFSASISGASAGVRLPSGGAAG